MSSSHSDYLHGDGESNAARVPFESRSGNTGAERRVSVESGLNGRSELGPDDKPLPSLRDASVRWILLLTVLMQLGSWAILGGYQLADSIEYVENAQGLVHGQRVLDSHAIRSFFFSLFLAPVLWITDALGVEDMRPFFGCFRAFQMLLGLALVVVTARLGARIGGRVAGLAAALFVAANPVFLQYTVSPVTDVAAALCVGLGVMALISPRRSGVLAGLWLGTAILCAYKTIPIVGAAGIVYTLRAWRDPAQRGKWGGLVLGVLAMLLVQIGLDWATYGRPGYSLQRYFLSNFGPIVAKPFFRLGLNSIATPLYDLALEADTDRSGVAQSAIHGRLPPQWYITHLHQFYAGPLVLFLLAGMWRSWRKPSWRTTLPIALTLLYVAVLSTKGTKDYRLWLPLLAVFTPFVGLGWSMLWGGAGTPAWRRTFAVISMLLAVGMGLYQLQDRNTRNFAGYWEALSWLNDKAEAQRKADPNAPRMRVASAYHWAVFMREGPDVHLTKLPHQLDGWKHLSPAERRANLFALLEQDWLIVHEPVLRNHEHADLLRVIGRHFVTEAVLWDREDYEDLGPILVLRHERDGQRTQYSRSLYSVIEDGDVEEYSRSYNFPEPMRLIRPDLGEEIWALGYEYEELPPHGHGWITYHYYNAGAQPQANYAILDRMTTYDERVHWQNNHAPAWGVYPTPTWQTGWIIRESWPVVACMEPYKWQEPYRPLGGAYRRGDLMPVNLWLHFVTQYWRCLTCGNPLDSEECCPTVDHIKKGVITNAQNAISGSLERARWEDSHPLRTGELKHIQLSQEGWRWSVDNLSLWGRFYMPVHDDAQVPDDGRPIEY